MQLNPLQQKVVNCETNCLVIGAPGTGKTSLILARMKKIMATENPESLAMVCYTPKRVSFFKNLMVKNLGSNAKRINYVTFNDLADQELKTAGLLEGEFADNSQMRRLMHQAKAEVGFAGSIHEAEHIVRNFKSKARKPQEGDDFYNLFNAYQNLLHSRNWHDRYDCVRKHLVSIRNGIAQPARIKYIFVDNAQDLNQIQTLWLLEHANAGIKVMLAVDDDQCIFERSGAMGAKLIDVVMESEAKFESISLERTYRLTKNVAKAAYKVVEFADRRYRKPELQTLDFESTLEIKDYNSIDQECDALASNIVNLFKSNPNSKAAVIVRNDNSADIVARKLAKKGIPFVDYARNIWENPGAIVVIDMLEVLLGTASVASLKNVLSTFGLKSTTIDTVLVESFDATNWLQCGAKLDRSLITEPQDLKKLVQVQSMLNSYYKVRTQVSLKDIFKALCFELMKNMSSVDKNDALIAIESIMSFKGKMKDNIDKVRQEKGFATNVALALGPARSFRNMEFDAVFMPLVNAQYYPCDYKMLGKKNSSDRRLFFAAVTRSKGKVFISYSKQPSNYLKSLLDK